MKSATLAVLLSIAAAAPALAGPPWITVEVRPHQFNRVIVHTFHHGTANPMPLRGTAHGLVDGRRVDQPLRIDPIAEGNNSYAVSGWGEQGVWVLSIADAEGTHLGAGAAVLVDRSGAVTVRYPRMFDGQTRAATHAEISAMLSTLDDQYLPPLRRGGLLSLGGPLALPALLLALLVLVVARAVGAATRRVRERRAAIA